MNLILLGAPGSGKGTQAAKLVSQYGFKQLSTGDIFRHQIATKTALGTQVQNYLNQGQLVPDEITNQVVTEALKHHPNRNLIFDGYPRTLQQAVALNQILANHHTQVDYAVYLDVPEPILVKRLSGRLICPKCQRSYQMSQFSHQTPICPHDGTKLIRRPDDEPDKVKVRLQTYQEATKPLIDYYKKHQLLISLKEQPNESVDSLFSRLVAAIKLNGHD